MREKNLYLVFYDIRDTKRWRRIYRKLKGYGIRVQYSVFRCRLSERSMQRMRWELEKILDKEDDLMVIRLCPRCASDILLRSPKDDNPFEQEELPFLILGDEAV